MSDDLSSVLQELVPRLDDEVGDWERVIADSGRETSTSTAHTRPFDATATSTARREKRVAWQDRWLTRRRLLVVALAVLLAALLVTPAFGVGGRLFNFVRGAPAPPEVQAYFAANDAYREQMLANAENAGEELYLYSWPVMTGQARGVFAIESPDGPIFLWSAPTEDGRRCSLIQTGTEAATGHLSCDGASDPALKVDVLSTPERPSVWIVHARVSDETITRVEVEVEVGPNVSLPVASGYGFGVVPKARRIVAFVGKNTQGDKVVTQR
jgi:hypothetical protein